MAVIAAALTQPGCFTSRHGNGNFGRVVSSDAGTIEHDESPLGLASSVAVDHELSSDHFLALNLTFENHSPDWIVVTEVTLDFGKTAWNHHVLVPYGQQLVWWAESALLDRAIDAHNREMLLGTIAAVGGVVAVTARDRGQLAVGAGLMAGATVGAAVADLDERLAELNRAKLFPDTHVLAGPFGVGPGLAVKRWLLLQMRDPERLRRLKGFYLTYRTATGHTERARYYLRYRSNLY